NDDWTKNLEPILRARNCKQRRIRFRAKTRTPPEGVGGVSGTLMHGIWEGWRAPLGKHMGAPEVPHRNVRHALIDSTPRADAGCPRSLVRSAARWRLRGTKKMPRLLARH